jgi:hypothetical protein
MPTKPTRSPHPPQSPEPESLAPQHSQVIVHIGRERHVLDLTSTLTALRLRAAEVISIEEKRKPEGRKSRPLTDVS